MIFRFADPVAECVKSLTGRGVRYVAIISFVDEPGLVAGPERARRLCGRVLPVHIKRAGLRNDRWLN